MMFKRIDIIDSKLDSLDRQLSSMQNDIETLNSKLSSINEVTDKLAKLDQLDSLIAEIKTLTEENAKLREENSVYEKYYDIGSEATDEIKKQVFAEFELERLRNERDVLEQQLKCFQSIAYASCSSASSLINYNYGLLGWGRY